MSQVTTANLPYEISSNDHFDIKFFAIGTHFIVNLFDIISF